MRSAPVARATAAAAPLPTVLLVLISLLFFVGFGLVTEALVRVWRTRAA